jgi:DNA polymerase III subunit delta'
MMMPWHSGHADLLWREAEAGTLAHAWVLAGSEGLGKAQFALHMAKGLLCQKPSGKAACGHCASCKCFEEDAHPDWHHIQSLEGAQSIGIDQIRSISDRLVKSPTMSARQIVCINPAEAMQAAAMNALLKTLEEPASNTLLFLVSHRPRVLPMTILSRVQMLRFAAPSTEVVLHWLSEQVHDKAQVPLAYAICPSPLQALRYLEDEACRLQHQHIMAWLSHRKEPWHLWAETLDGRDAVRLLLDLMLRMLSASLKVMGGEQSVWLKTISAPLDAEALWLMQQKIMEAYPQLRAGSGVLPRGIAEDLCMSWEQLWGSRTVESSV